MDDADVEAGETEDLVDGVMTQLLWKSISSEGQCSRLSHGSARRVQHAHRPDGYFLEFWQ